jgi:hypothetical protein
MAADRITTMTSRIPLFLGGDCDFSDSDLHPVEQPR